MIFYDHEVWGGHTGIVIIEVIQETVFYIIGSIL